jgi:Xaa-Pro aminopeptidase
MNGRKTVKNKATRKKARRGRLLYAASEIDADILYATGFFAPDPFPFIEVGRTRLVIMNDLEVDRAQAQATVTRVVSRSRVERALKRRGAETGNAHVIAEVLAGLRVRTVEVPQSFPLGLAMELDELGVRLETVEDPFWPERAIKRRDEVRAITRSLRAAEAGLLAGIEALRSCTIRRDGYLGRDRRRFTVEDLRGIVHQRLMAEGCIPSHTICAPGDQAVDPHEEGHGPIRAHTPIVMDIFPRSMSTGYWGDLTRTVVRGRASERLKEVYALVSEGVDLGHRSLRDGADGPTIHQAIMDLFTSRGYPTGRKGGRMQGFFHGTGHGLGLAIHEAPSISVKRPDTLRAGNVVTVEPGLYYLGLGGVRIEDVAVVTQRGSRNLTQVPRVLEV